MYSSLRMTTFIPFLLTIFVSTIIAYPAKIDLNEGYYFNRFHDFPDGYEGKDVRNLDGIDHRVPVYEDYGITLVDRTNGKSGGGESTEYRLHNPFSLLFSQTLPASSGSSMHIDGIGGGHLVRNLAAASASASAAARQGLARPHVDAVANRFNVVDLYRASVRLEKINGDDRTIDPSSVSQNTYILKVAAPSTDGEGNIRTNFANDDNSKPPPIADLTETELKSAIPINGNSLSRPFSYNHKLFKRDLDALGGGHLLRSLNSRDLDALGGGHLLRSLNSRDLDALGGGHLLRSLNSRDLDALGGGHLLRSLNSRDLDALGGGHLLRSLNSRDLDALGGGHLLRSLNSRDLDALGGGHLLRSLNVRDLDALGGGHLLKRSDKRDLDSIGGGNLLRHVTVSNPDSLGGDQLLESADTKDLGKENVFGSLNLRDLDEIGGGNLLRSLSYRDLDALGGGHLLRSLDSRDLDAIGGGNLLRSLNSRDLDAIGGGNLLRSLEETKS